MLDQEHVRELALRLDATGRSQGSEAGSDLDRPVQWRDGARRAQMRPSPKERAPNQSAPP
jgi:hypothetical protein